jgi:hypothetical protein
MCDDEAILRRLPVRVRNDILHHQSLQVFRVLPIFKHIRNVSVRLLLLNMMKQHVAFTGRRLWKEGERCEELLFMYDGHALLTQSTQPKEVQQRRSQARRSLAKNRGNLSHARRDSSPHQQQSPLRRRSQHAADPGVDKDRHTMLRPISEEKEPDERVSGEPSSTAAAADTSPDAALRRASWRMVLGTDDSGPASPDQQQQGRPHRSGANNLPAAASTSTPLKAGGRSPFSTPTPTPGFSAQKGSGSTPRPTRKQLVENRRATAERVKEVFSTPHVLPTSPLRPASAAALRSRPRTARPLQRPASAAGGGRSSPSLSPSARALAPRPQSATSVRSGASPVLAPLVAPGSTPAGTGSNAPSPLSPLSPLSPAAAAAALPPLKRPSSATASPTRGMSPVTAGTLPPRPQSAASGRSSPAAAVAAVSPPALRSVSATERPSPAAAAHTQAAEPGAAIDRRSATDGAPAPAPTPAVPANGGDEPAAVTSPPPQKPRVRPADVGGGAAVPVSPPPHQHQPLPPPTAGGADDDHKGDEHDAPPQTGFSAQLRSIRRELSRAKEERKRHEHARFRRHQHGHAPRPWMSFAEPPKPKPIWPAPGWDAPDPPAAAGQQRPDGDAVHAVYSDILQVIHFSVFPLLCPPHTTSF